ncbi:MAG: oligosaccharide flippase family protein [Flavonifractor plautii]
MKLDRTSMLYGTLILTGTSIVSQFLGFVYRILLSRLIGAEVMGLYQLIMPVFSVIMALTAVGLTVAVSNLSSQYHARGNRAAIAQVLRRCLAVFLLLFAAVAAVVVLLYDPISVYLLGDARTQLGLLLLLPCILLTGVENLHKHFFYGTGNIRPPAAVELCEQFIRTGAVLGLLVVFLPQNPERTVGLIVTGMILQRVCSPPCTLLLLARRHLNRAGGLTGSAAGNGSSTAASPPSLSPSELTSLLGNLMGSATSVPHPPAAGITRGRRSRRP